MLGVRYALMYPDDVDQLVLADPIGLEDWKSQGRAVAERRRVVRSGAENHCRQHS